ncbi:Concanavalin A-like lectin/glucanases superfamily protein [Candidatus Tiddalikarchaeum anstoanum]|nr:Concanavalin A-like lectin/glucanases superfamily protein [Candidatus Tiddalikarchaeum anstoanum]
MQKAQAALEYLMVFGWAVLIIIVVGAALYALGVFNPSYDIGRQTEFTLQTREIGTLDHRMCSEGFWQISIISRGPAKNITRININGVDFFYNTYLSPSLPLYLSGNNSALRGAFGSEYNYRINITYIQLDSGIPHNIMGSFRGYYDSCEYTLTHYLTFSPLPLTGGNYVNTTLISSSVLLQNGRKTGYFESAVFDVGSDTSYESMNWSEDLPYGEELPNNNFAEAAQNGTDMAGNKLLFHLNDNVIGSGKTITDYSYYDNDGLTFGNLDCTLGGLFNEACYFDGASYINITKQSNQVLNTNTFTLSLWFKTDYNHPAYGASTEGRMLNFHKDSIQGSAAALYVEQDKIGVVYNNGTNRLFITHNEQYYDNKWHHLALTYSGITYRLYYDGQLVEEVNDSFGGFGAYSPKIGSWDGVSRFYKGYIDEVAVYSRTLSSNELIKQYLRGALHLNIAVRACDSSSCLGVPWSSTFENNINTNINLVSGRYFQYKFYYTTENAGYTPILYSVGLNYWKS